MAQQMKTEKKELVPGASKAAYKPGPDCASVGVKRLSADEQARLENLFVDLLKHKKAGELAEEMARLEKAGIAIAPIMESAAKIMGWIRE
jgi:hypothetical protein